jgi:hypothetical protein
MRDLSRRIFLVLLPALVTVSVGTAQKRNHTYQASELSAQAAATVVIDRFGIAPASIQRPVGAFLLAIRDVRGKGAEHFSVTLDKDGAPELFSLDTAPNRCHGAILVDLERGKYRLRLSKSPDLSVAIEVK